MRSIICLLVVVLLATACKKQVEAKKEDLLLNLITDGRWDVTKFLRSTGRDTTDETGNFSPYSFQFKKDFTVDALNNGRVEATGTWQGSMETYTVTSSFPTYNPILLLLNGTWQLTDADVNFVEAHRTDGIEYRFLRLVKE